MTNIAVTPQTISRSGITPSYMGSLSTSNTYQVSNNGKTFVHFKKTGAGACTVTFVSESTVDGLAVADRTGSVPATTGDKMFGPFPTDVYGRTLNITLSEVTGLSIAAFRMAE